MHDAINKYQRKSYMEIDQLFFWTATINNWYHLLKENKYKQVILDSLSNLSERELVEVFAFVIMPNHVHFIWRTLSLNGKETVQGSFLKFTAHAFKKMLKEDKADLSKYEVDVNNKRYEFWQRDSLAVHLYTKEVMLQKLNYIHRNPVVDRWQLAVNTSDYYFSSAKFYETGERVFSFLKDVRELF